MPLGMAPRYGPKPDQLVTKLDLAAAAAGEPDASGKVGVYKPPKLNPVAMDMGARTDLLMCSSAHLLICSSAHLLTC